MTPIEKARKIYNRYRIDPVYNEKRSTHIDSIDCAIIAVEEIISIGTQSYFMDYWNEVLTELKSMK